MLLYQCEVQLFLFQVGACHFDGNIYTEEVEGIQVHRYGAHIFHTSSKAVVMNIFFICN